jgi:oligopeptide transport system substrate-binding protein
LVLTACGSSGDSTTSSSSTAAGAGTGEGAATGEATGGGEPTTGIVTALGGEPQNPLLPSVTNETGGGQPLELIGAGLVYYDDEGNPQNEVAESITSDDGQHYTIKLKEGWKFTNGEPVTASSFVDAWNYAALVTNAGLQASFFDPIVGYEDVSACGATDPDSGECTKPAPTAETMSGLKVVDDTTFTVDLVSPQADFPLRLGYTAYYPMAKEALADPKKAGENPIGNGPYKLEKWDHNASINLVPNPDYQGGRKAQNGGVDFMIYTSSEAAYTDVLADNLDVINTIPPSSLSSFETDLGDRAVKQPYAGTTTMSIPVTMDHFKMDEEGRLRRAALSYAIDRDSIVNVIFNGTRTPAVDFSAPGIAGWSDSIPGSEVLKYDEAKAKELWAQADAINPWSGTFKFGYNADGPHKEWSEAVVNSIKNTLGIEAEAAPTATFGEFRQLVTTGALGYASRAGWQADYPSIYNFLGPLYSAPSGQPAGANDAKYVNPDFDALLTKGLSATSVDESNKYFQQAQEILFKDLPNVPLWYSTATGGSSTLVSGVKFDWRGQPILYAVTKQ